MAVRVMMRRWMSGGASPLASVFEEYNVMGRQEGRVHVEGTVGLGALRGMREAGVVSREAERALVGEVRQAVGAGGRGTLFVVNEKTLTPAPLLVFPTVSCHFCGPSAVEELTVQSLHVLSVLLPRPELVLIGCGSSVGVLPSEVRQHFLKEGISFEVTTTVHAMSTFNFLSDEGRSVAALLYGVGDAAAVEDLLQDDDEEDDDGKRQQ